MGVSISGLSGSGIDTTKLIETIMKEESIPYNNLQTKIDNTTAYRKFFNSMKTQLSNLKDAAKALGDLDSFKATAATSSNSSALSAVAADKSAIAGDYLINVKSLAKSQVSASNPFATGGTFTATGTLTLTRNGVTSDLLNLNDPEIQGKPMDEALAAIVTKINGLTDMGVKASVVQTKPGEKTLVITSSKTGEENSFTLGGGTSFWQAGDVQSAKNAEIEVNGLTVFSSTNEVKDAIQGVTLNLTGEGKSTVKVSQDTSSITTKIETFVKAYNDIVTTIRDNTKKSEKNSDGSLSLTLQGDPMLRDLLSQLNNWMNTKVGGDNSSFQLFSQIGLEIDKGVTSASMMTGKITFDKELFAKKLAADPDVVEKMFNGDIIASTDSSGNAVNISFSKMLDDNLQKWTNSVDGLISTKIKGYDSEISYVTEQMTNMKTRLTQREEGLKKQYATFEVMMKQLNNQKDWITSQFAALTKSSS